MNNPVLASEVYKCKWNNSLSSYRFFFLSLFEMFFWAFPALPVFGGILISNKYASFYTTALPIAV